MNATTASNTPSASAFDSHRHPRNSADGRFVEASLADPGSDLLCGGEDRFDWMPDDELLGLTKAFSVKAVSRRQGQQQRFGLDADDVQGDVLEAIVRRRRRQVEESEQSDKPPIDLSGSDERAVAMTIARHRESRQRAPWSSPMDLIAGKKLQSVRDEFLASHGREMTPDELNEAAARVRMSFPAGRRPHPDFHVGRPVNVPMLKDLGEDLTASREEGFADGSFGDKVLGLIEAGEKRNHGPYRYAYLALAEHRGAPMPAEKSISEDHATKARKTMKGMGGAFVVARRVAGGLGTAAEVKMLMTAFPESEHHRVGEVAEVLIAHPNLSDELWSSSLQFATIRSPRARLADKPSSPAEGEVA